MEWCSSLARVQGLGRTYVYLGLLLKYIADSRRYVASRFEVIDE